MERDMFYDLRTRLGEMACFFPNPFAPFNLARMLLGLSNRNAPFSGWRVGV